MGALDSQETSSQEWLEEVCRKRNSLPLFLPEPEDDLPAPRDPLASKDSDSDKENQPPPSLRVPLLPWSQRRKFADILTRIAFGHETMASGVLELRDAVLVAGLSDEEEVEAQEEHRDPPVAHPAKEDGDTTCSESGDDSVSQAGTGGANPHHRDLDSPTPAVGGFLGLASRLGPDFRSGGSVAAVVADALNYTKRKADAMEPTPQDPPEKRQIRRRVVPTPTESQVERDDRRREEYKEANRQRLAEGLSPRRPRRRGVVEPPSPVQTPSTQSIGEMFGYNFHGSQAEALQSGFQVRRG